MKNKITLTVSIVSILLWIGSISVFLYYFLKGKTIESDDKRTAVVLNNSEKDLVLREMRTLLLSVNGIVKGLGEENYPQAEEWAKKAGMGLVYSIEVQERTIIAKLPIEMKELGLSTHRDFDHLAGTIAQKQPIPVILKELGQLTSKCIVCHNMYKVK